jgi:hypothetical protein
MDIEWAAKATPFYLYDGTNGAELVSVLQVFVSLEIQYTEVDGVLTMDFGYNNVNVLHAGDRFSPSGESVTPAQWSSQYVTVSGTITE